MINGTKTESVFLQVCVDYDYALVARLTRFLIFKGRAYRFCPWVFVALTMLAMLILGILFAWSRALEMLFMMGCMALIFLLGLFMWISLPRISYNKRSRKSVVNMVEYRFSPEYMEIVVSGENPEENNRLRYDMVKRFYETETDFYLLLKNGTAYCVPKMNLISGQIINMRRFLIKTFPNRFVRCF